MAKLSRPRKRIAIRVRRTEDMRAQNLYKLSLGFIERADPVPIHHAPTVCVKCISSAVL